MPLKQNVYTERKVKHRERERECRLPIAALSQLQILCQAKNSSAAQKSRSTRVLGRDSRCIFRYKMPIVIRYRPDSSSKQLDSPYEDEKSRYDITNHSTFLECETKAWRLRKTLSRWLRGEGRVGGIPYSPPVP